MKTLASIDHFGGIDADADALLDSCFQDHEAYRAAIEHQRTLILGRKGSGKTAIYRKIVGTSTFDVFALGHSFAEYPWHHHKLQELANVPEELRFVQSWQYLILLSAARVLLDQDQSQPWDETATEELSALERFLVDSYGSRKPDLSQLFTPSRRLRFRPSFKLPGELANVGLDIERLPTSELPRIIDQVNRRVTEAILACLNPSHHYFICFDELDRGFDPSSQQYARMLIGLILAAKQLNQRIAAAGKRLSVLVFLRDDIYQILRFEDKNKITEVHASTIEWDSPRSRWTLKQLMEKRFEAVLGADVPVAWGSVFDEGQEMPGRQRKYQHILDRTFNRPRDMIKFCNEVLSAFKARGASEGQLFANDDITAARAPYSDYLLRELDDEVHKHLPAFENHLEALRTVGTAIFSRDIFESVCAKRPQLVAAGGSAVDLLRELFGFSIVAYQKTGGVGGGSEYVWRYQDSRSRFDESALQFRVHPGLIEALGLKRFAQRRCVDIGSTIDGGECAEFISD